MGWDGMGWGTIGIGIGIGIGEGGVFNDCESWRDMVSVVRRL